MNTHPRIIRLGQIINDLPSMADSDEAPDRVRIELARAIALDLSPDALSRDELLDPTMGVARTQKALHDLTIQGYQTAFSRPALATHAIDVLTDEGIISDLDAPQYLTGQSDPTAHIEAFLKDQDFVKVTTDEVEYYYLSPRF